MKAGQPRHLRSSDIKLIRVFRAVADSGSFAGAQSLLNVSASTISTQISTLEARLGMRLCSRGRTGFRLTEEGRRVLEASQKLFAAHDEFSSDVWSTQKRQRKVLRIGIVDSVISNKEFRLSEALQLLCEKEGIIEFHISSFSPSEIEQGVLNSAIDVGIGVFMHRIPGLHYDSFLNTEQVLCCSHLHPCFNRATNDMIIDEITELPYAARSYVGERSMVPGVLFNFMAYTQSIEAAALLVLTGQYIAHLPRYYAEKWVSKGEMRIIQSDRLSYNNRFGFVVRKDTKPMKLATSLLALLVELHNTR